MAILSLLWSAFYYTCYIAFWIFAFLVTVLVMCVIYIRALKS